MDGKGLPYFHGDTFRGNRIYYVAGTVIQPDLPFWVACRDALAGCGLVDARAKPEQTWEALAYWQTTGPSLFTNSKVTTPPIRSAYLLQQVEPLFTESAHNTTL